jgi:HAE1 family hydrophobic/amphiphilic exporter-1
MKLPHFAVTKPVFTTMVILIVLILGAVSLSRLPIDLMPDITYPTINIGTSYENAGPREIEELVTRPIEEALASVPGVDQITSESYEGSSSVRVTFSWGTDLNEATNDVRDRLDRIIAKLPDDATRPMVRKFDPSSFPILMLGASSKLDPIQMRRIIDDQIKYRIERVPGVASVDIGGGRVREIHVDVDPDRLKSVGLTIDVMLAKLKDENVNMPAGVIERGTSEITLRTPAEFTSLDEIKATVITYRNAKPVRVRDVAAVSDSYRKVTQIININGEPGTRFSVTKRSGTNTVEVATRVLEEIAKINVEIPQIKITVINDSSDYIKRSISNVTTSALYGGLFTIIILLLFLGSIRSSIIIGLSIPISIIATFALMYFGGFTLNIMTLGGLALGIGMLVDNSIVVLENIFRRRESGDEPRLAVLEGTGEVGAAVTASTLTTLAVFLPLIFVRGMAGVMFKELAYVISFALACSLISALTIVPMLSSKMFASKSAHGSKTTFGKKGVIFSAFESFYISILRGALKHRSITVLIVILALGGSLMLGQKIGFELMPATDEGEVRVNIEMEAGTKLDIMGEKLALIEKIVRENVPEMKTMVSQAGSGGGMGGPHGSGGSTGSIRITLKPVSERKRSSEQVANDLRAKLSNISGCKITTRTGQGFFMFRMGHGTERVQVEIRGHDFDNASKLALEVKKFVESVPGVTDAQVSQEGNAQPEMLIAIDRIKAADLGLTVSQIASAIQTAFAGVSATNFREEGSEYSIRVKLENAEKKSIEDILNLSITSSRGEQVLIRNLANLTPGSGPVGIERKDRERIITVSGNTTGRDYSSILDDVREKLKYLRLPKGFSIGFGGEYEEQVQAFSDLLLGLGLALILVYMVMACQYESLRDPFIVMFSVPLAVIGVILMLFLTKTTFNVQSFIGCIMLGGIVVNNAILLVDHTNLLRNRDKMELYDAIVEAGRRRLRPILMTALTTMMGLAPLALALGEGSEAQAPLARAVIGGLASSTLITLVFVPVVYSFFTRKNPRNPA